MTEMRDRNQNRNELPGDAKIAQNQKEDKRAFKKFIVIILLSAVVGGIIGVCSIALAPMRDGLMNGLSGVIWAVGPWMNLVYGVVIHLITARQSRRFQKLYAGWDGEDELLAGQMEDALTVGMAVTAAGQIIGYFFFALGFWEMDAETDLMWSMLRLLASFVGIGYVTVLVTRMQKRFVNDTKLLNPEKQGSVYDMKFMKRWMDSCDEMERMQIYQASWRAYRTTQMAFLISWVICFAGMLSWGFGILPVFLTTVLWMVQSMSYVTECMRISKHAAVTFRQG